MTLPTRSLVEIEEKGSYAILTPKVGLIDVGNAMAFRSALQSVIEGRANLIIDLCHVRYMDSTGMGCLYVALKAIQKNQGQIRLCNVDPRLQPLLRLVNAADFFAIDPDLAASEKGLMG